MNENTIEIGGVIKTFLDELSEQEKIKIFETFKDEIKQQLKKNYKFI